MEMDKLILHNTYGAFFLSGMLLGALVFMYIKYMYSDYRNLDGFLLSIPIVIFFSKISAKIIYDISFFSFSGFASVGGILSLCLLTVFIYDSQIDFVALATSWATAGALIRVGNVFNEEIIMLLMGKVVYINAIESKVLALLSLVSIAITTIYSKSKSRLNIHVYFICCSALFLLSSKILSESERMYYIDNIFLFYFVSLLEGFIILYKLFEKRACR